MVNDHTPPIQKDTINQVDLTSVCSSLVQNSPASSAAPKAALSALVLGFQDWGFIYSNVFCPPSHLSFSLCSCNLHVRTLGGEDLLSPTSCLAVHATVATHGGVRALLLLFRLFTIAVDCGALLCPRAMVVQRDILVG